MTPIEAAVQRRLSELAGRLEVIEDRLGISREAAAARVPAPGAAPGSPASAPTPPPAAPAPIRTSAPPLFETREAHPPLAQDEADDPSARARRRAALGALRGASPPPPTPRAAQNGVADARPAARPRFERTPVARDKQAELRLERFVGGRAFAALGAVAVVAAAAFFLKYAYDQGWLDLIPPHAKCLSVAGFGVALLLAGEWARRKINALASAGLSAAGIGALYAAAFAAWGQYHLVSDGAAFALLAGAAGVGVAVSARARLASVGALSLVGCYITPLLLHDAHVGTLVLPAYLLALLCMGVGLAGWRGGPFVVLRSMSWWGTALLGGWWGLTHAAAAPLEVCVFAALCWTVVHAELVWTMRPRGAIDKAAAPSLRRLSWAQARPFSTSFATTCWSVGIAVFALQSSAWATLDWLAPAGGFAACAALSLVLAGNLRVLRDDPIGDAQRLGAGLMMQAGALLLLTLALGLTGWTQSLAWLAIGLGALGAGRWLRARSLDVYGLVALAIGTARIALYDSLFTTAMAGGQHTLGMQFTLWSALAAGAGGAWLAAGALLRGAERDGWRAVAHGCVAVGLTAIFLAPMHPLTELPAAIALGLGLGAALCVTGRRLGAPGLGVCGVAALVASCGRLLMVGWWDSAAVGDGYVVLGLHLTQWTPVVLAAGGAWFLCAALFGTREKPAHVAERGFLTGVGSMLVMGAFAHNHADPGSLVILWAAIGLGCLALGRVVRAFALEHVGLVPLTGGAMVWALAWTANGWRDAAGVAGPTWLHPALLSGLAIGAAAMAAARWLLPPDAPDRPGLRAQRVCMAIGGLVLLFASTSAEVARAARILSSDATAQAAAVSIWWAVFGAGLLSYGFARQIGAARHAGLVVVLLALAKTVIIDLVDIAPIWRVASFLALGLVMLGVAVVYARLTGGGRAAQAREA